MNILLKEIAGIFVCHWWLKLFVHWWMKGIYFASFYFRIWDLTREIKNPAKISTYTVGLQSKEIYNEQLFCHTEMQSAQYFLQNQAIDLQFSIFTQQDYYGRQCGTLLHSYCTSTYTEVTVLLLWSSSNATFEYPRRYCNRVAVWILCVNSRVTSQEQHGYFSVDTSPVSV